MTYNVSPNHTNTFDFKRPTLCNLLSLNYQINSSRLKSGQAWSLKMALLCRTTAVPWINITLRRGTKINKCRNHCVETSPTVCWGKVHLLTPYLFRSCINHKLQKVVLLSHKFTKSVMFCAVSLVQRSQVRLGTDYGFLKDVLLYAFIWNTAMTRKSTLSPNVTKSLYLYCYRVHWKEAM